MTSEETSVNSMLPSGPLLPWWLVLIQGIVLLIIGGYLLTSPYQTLLVLVWFVGAYWLISGIFALISLAVDSSNMGWKILMGILGIIAGTLILIYPYYSTILLPTMLIIFIGVWGLIIGVITLLHAMKGGGWGEGILGFLAIIFGILLLANPLIGAALLPYVLGIFAIIGGIGAIISAFMFRPKT
jgi:uncharacterized membrane protein HdeD (DUF308 family)